MAGKHGRKKPTQKKSGNSTSARENVAPVVEEHVEEQSDGNNSDDLSPDLCEPSEEIKGRKRNNRSSISGGVSTRTRARKAVSDGNEPVGEDVVHEESTQVREKTAVSLSLDFESEDISAVSSKRKEIMAGKRGRKKPTQKKSGNSTRARENIAPVVEEHVEEQSDGKNSDDLSPDLCEPSEGWKRKNPSSISGGVSTRTRARKVVSDGNEPVGENEVHEESTRVREKTAVSLSLDSESEDMSAVSSKVINSVLVPTLGEETLLARIIDEEPECYPEGSASDTWNHWLVVKEKKIWWKELYEQDTGARVFTKQKDKEKPKLEVMDWRMSKLERNQRLLRSRAKKIEDRLTSIERKGNEAEENNYGEYMDFGQWDNMDCGRPEGLDKTAAEENYDRAKGKDKDTGEKENEENTTDKRLSKRLNKRLRKSKRLSKKLRKSKGKRSKRSSSRVKMVRKRTKAAAARKLVHTPPEKFFQFARPSEEEELARLKERCVVQAEKLWRQIEEEESDEKSVESLAEEEVEKTQENAEKLVEEPEKTVEEEESPTKEAATPAKKKTKAEKKKVDGAPKKRGKPKKTVVTLKPCTPLPEKRKGEPSRWVQSPFT
ncbi:hypothetical protein DY000_02037747 [Brassica cretica]|uniref:DUF287 domain-containing protein n=1 Tax=Brassica cretica TaxID=69181 RepID=A0ABQ7B7J7_BRACR|nr:hypothetical protein DY000_02037747 [Brassica cretica]